MTRIDTRHHDDRGERTIAKRERLSKMTDPVEYALEVVARGDKRLADERKELEASISTAWQRVEKAKATTAEAKAQAEQAKLEAENAKRQWQMAIGVAERERDELPKGSSDTLENVDDTLKDGDDITSQPIDTSDTTKPSTTPKRGLTASESIAQRKTAAPVPAKKPTPETEPTYKAKPREHILLETRPDESFVMVRQRKYRGPGNAPQRYIPLSAWNRMSVEEHRQYDIFRTHDAGNHFGLAGYKGKGRGVKVHRSRFMR